MGNSIDNDFLQNLNRNFVPRPTEEIVKLIVSALLGQENLVQSWNAGGTLPLGEIPASVLSLDLLSALKSECGGLQTLLRNHNHIFIVIKGDVRLRHPLADHHDLGKKNPSKNSDKFKGTKPCWFYENHPQGCPIKDAKDCFWLHPNRN